MYKDNVEIYDSTPFLGTSGTWFTNTINISTDTVKSRYRAILTLYRHSSGTLGTFVKAENLYIMAHI